MGENIPLGYQNVDGLFVCSACSFAQYGVVGNPYSMSNHATLWQEAEEDLVAIYSWDADNPHGITCDSCGDAIDEGWCERVNKGNGNGYCEDCYDTAEPEGGDDE